MRRLLVGLSALLCTILPTALTQANPYDTWMYRAAVTFSGYTQGETLTNFPVLLRISTNTISGFLYSQLKAVADGADLRFSSSNGTDELDYEIEAWDTNGTSLVWVKTPTIAGTSDCIYMYWGKTGASADPCTTNGAVWTNAFSGVWHLDEPSGNAADATSNRNSGTVGGTTTQGAAGQLGSAYQFNSSSYVTINTPVGATATISAWAKSPVAAGALANMLWAANGQKPDLFFYSGVICLNNYDGAGNPYCAVPSTVDQMHHYVAVIDASRNQLYIDGVFAGTATYVNPAGSTFLISDSHTYGWPGVIDEVEISSVARSSNWIWAAWANQASNSTFVSYGAAGPQSRPSIQNQAPTNIAAGAAWLNGYLASTGQSPVTVSVYWGDADGGDPTGGLWQATNTWAEGAWEAGSSPTYHATGMTPNTFYYYRFYATNAGGDAWSETTENFLAGDVAVTVADGTATESVLGGDTGRFIVQRDASATNEALTINYQFLGAATAGSDYTAAPAGTSLVLPAGVASTNIIITALWDSATNEGPESVWLALLPGKYGIEIPSSNVVTIADGHEEAYWPWPYRTKLSFNTAIGETLADFPVLVVLNTNLVDFSYGQFASPAGADLRFSLADKFTPLNYEIEKWDTNGNSYVWVQVPALAGGGEFIYAYWGFDTNAPACTTNGATWDSTFRAVWHLRETTGASCFDATTNAQTGVKAGNTTAAAGVIDGGQRFDGAADYIDAGTPASLDIGAPRTISAWITPTALNQYACIVAKDSQRSGTAYSYMMTCHSDGTLQAYDGGAWRASANRISAGNTYYTTFVTPGDGNIYFYVNGAAAGSAAWTYTDNPAHNVYLGSWYAPGTTYDFNGVIDEARIEATARSAAWINACYLNQKTNSSFVTYGATLTLGTLNVEANAPTEITAYSATAHGDLATTNALPAADVYVCWGYTDSGTADTGDWAHVTFAGTLGQDQRFSLPLSNLLPGSNYAYRCFATNAAGSAWSPVAQTFATKLGWYVATGGDGTDGKSWATAFTNIQDALDSASSGESEIYIGGGQYLVPAAVSNMGWNGLVWSNSNVAIFGGYEAIGTPGSRDPATWPTIISRPADSTNRIMLITGVANGLLTGVTVSNGFAYCGMFSPPPYGHPNASGGGLFVYNCPSLRIEDCRIVQNQTLMEIWNGGDIYGGGIYMENSGVIISNCVVFSNKVVGFDSTNIQYGNGGGAAQIGGSLRIYDSLIFNNLADGDYLHGVNKGGGLYLNGTAEIRDTILKYNDSIQWAWSAISRGDGAFVGSGGNVLFKNCLIADNHGADIGIGIWQEAGTLRLENCTLATNKNYGVYRNGGSMTISNCILWANGDDVYEAAVGGISLAYNDIEDGDSLGVNGNISDNPLFADATYYHPQSVYSNYANGFFAGGNWAAALSNSSTIDACDPAIRPTAEPVPNGGIVNMGYDGDTPAASKSHPLEVTNAAPTAVTLNSATLNGAVLQVGTPDVDLWFYYGTSDGGTIASAWDTNVYAGKLSSAGAISADVADLQTGVAYAYTLFASNAAGETAWAAPSSNFSATLSAPSVVNQGALNEGGPTVTLKGEITSTGGENPLVFICWGLTEGLTDTGSWEHVEALGTESGAFQTDIATLAGSNYFYTCYATNSGGGTWAAPALPFGAFRDRYVDANATGGGTGYSWSNAFTTIQAALNACDNSKTNRIYIKRGAYTLVTSLTWTGAHINVQGGYAGSGMPGALDAGGMPTVITNNGGSFRILTVSSASDGRLENVTLTAGNVGGNGGGIAIANAANITLLNCTVRRNQATGYGGGAAVSSSTGILLNGCTLTKNLATNDTGSALGGALYADNSFGTITNCVIERNVVGSASGSYYHWGAGLYLTSGGWLVRDSHIAYNRVNNYNAGAGGVYANTALTLKNCVIAGNSAAGIWTRLGGDGVYVGGGTLTSIENCTLIGNNGEGVHRQAGAATVTDSILWKNGDDVAGAVGLSYCDIENGDSNGVNGCISAHPLFERGVYLGAGSPCLDQGSTNATDAGLAGYTTRADGTPDSGRVDMGYHAFTGIDPAIADLYVAESGSDGNSGTNAAQPLRSVTKALAIAREGSHIHVAAGSYTNGVETFPLPMGRYGLQLLGTNAALTLLQAPGNPTQARAIEMQDCTFSLLAGVTISGGYLFGTVDGAGVYVYNAAEALIDSCIISNNYLNCGGNQNTRGSGLFSDGNTFVILTNCIVTKNTGYGTGGHNTGYNRGSGLYILRGQWTILNSVFAQNIIYCNNLNDGSGAGMYLQGGPHLIRNCLIVSNDCQAGGYCYPGNGFDRGGVWGDGFEIEATQPIRMENCTVAYNGGEGIRIYSGSLALSNSITWGNGLDLTNGGSLAIGSCDVGTPVDYAGTNGCLSADPLFADLTYFHVKSSEGYYTGGFFADGAWAAASEDSPAIDAGDRASAYLNEPQPNGRRINLGAYGNTSVASKTRLPRGAVFTVW